MWCRGREAARNCPSECSDLVLYARNSEWDRLKNLEGNVFVDYSTQVLTLPEGGGAGGPMGDDSPGLPL